jgi:hypothetical protein
MAKITINDTEYYTDDFNEEQAKAYQEIMVASSEIERISYVAQVLDARRQMLAGMIEQLANKGEAEKLPDEES